MIALIKGWIGSAASWIAPIVIVILLAALGYQRYAIESKSRDLELCAAKSAQYKSVAEINYESLISVRSEFNASLNSCFTDYADLSRRFDDYREAVAASEVKPTPAPQTATCEIGGANALVDRLNALNY